jgi:antitoxin (DNA-binding transcriptional repressor) of toxin-antitoxin stability system
MTIYIVRRAPVKHVSVAEAKAKLSEILDGVIAGEEVIITRRGKEVAKLVLPHAPIPKVPLDIDAILESHKRMKMYPGNSVVDMRETDRY